MKESKYAALSFVFGVTSWTVTLFSLKLLEFGVFFGLAGIFCHVKQKKIRPHKLSKLGNILSALGFAFSAIIILLGLYFSIFT